MEKLNLADQIREFTIVRFRNEECAIVLMPNSGGLCMCTKQDLESHGYTSNIYNYYSDLKHSFNAQLNIDALKNYPNAIATLSDFLSGDIDEWDWERVEPVEITLEELIELATKQLGRPIILKEVVNDDE